MRIVDRKTFLSLSEETLYSKYESDACKFGDLSIKVESLENDFFTQPIVDAIKCSGSDEFDDILFMAEHSGKSFLMDFERVGRDGLYNDNQLFAVWEKDDIIALIERLNKLLT